ncbi:MAG: class I SAM-dependent methyltransferase [Anaerohalosphaera sp.]|nr:class I SAM-dependent methyltransferase [Anaerohalosphaera sp.]
MKSKALTAALVIVILTVIFNVFAGQIPQQPRRPRRQPQPAAGTVPTTTALAADQAEQKTLDVLADMNKNQSRGMMNVPPNDGRFLRVITEAIDAKTVVEIGTSNGYSGIWFCMALRKTGGKLITYEIDQERADLARKNFKRADVEDMITLVFGDAHKEVTKIKGPIDILFLDADKQGYMDYMEKLLPLVRPGGLILAHNTTNAGPQMKDYIEEITTNPKLETLFIHSQQRGIGLTLKKR